ncbi:hypothetical protein ACYULU_14925 [Breznakiellaceae bacterium SP9]
MNAEMLRSPKQMAIWPSYGRNGWAASGIPSALESRIKALNADGQYIRDIQLTENGRWLILSGNNGASWGGIPDNDSLLTKLRQYNDWGETITSVTFNDYGDWVIITKNYFAASDTDISDWLKEGSDKFGQIWAVCIADTDAIVAVFESGYRYLGDVPENLKNALKNTDIDVYRIKIAGSSWFFADENGYYEGWL